MNEQFFAARKRTPSPVDPLVALSRKELAELVREWVLRNLDRDTPIDETHIGRIERGEIRWPRADYRAGLRAVLGVDSDSDLGFLSPRGARRVRLEDVDRKEFLRGGAATLALAPFVALLNSARTQPPRRIGGPEVQQVRSVAEAFEHLDFTHGGGLAREAVAAQLRWSTDLLGTSCTPDVRADLFSAVGYLGYVCGFMAFDANAYNDARRIYRVALGCAQEVEDAHLEAKVLWGMSRLATGIDDPTEGLGVAEYALVKGDRLSPAERAMLCSAKARAHGRMLDVNQTFAAIDQADSHFTDVTTDDEMPPWMAYFDLAHHCGDTGHVLCDLALASGNVPAAELSMSRERTAIREHRNEHPRSRMFSQVLLATVTMHASDPDEAVMLGNEALESAGAFRSQRATTMLGDLRRVAEKHSGRPVVDDLRHRIESSVRDN